MTENKSYCDSPILLESDDSLEQKHNEELGFRDSNSPILISSQDNVNQKSSTVNRNRKSDSPILVTTKDDVDFTSAVLSKRDCVSPSNLPQATICISDDDWSPGKTKVDRNNETECESCSSKANVPGASNKKREPRKFSNLFTKFSKADKKKLEKEEVKVEVPKAGDVRYIAGVQVEFPVKPYGSQLTLMHEIIKGIKQEQNCLLESPTGSGKTLALLCATLAWQKHEKERITKMFQDNMILLMKNYEYESSPEKDVSTCSRACRAQHTPSKSHTDQYSEASNVPLVGIHKRIKMADPSDESMPIGDANSPEKKYHGNIYVERSPMRGDNSQPLKTVPDSPRSTSSMDCEGMATPTDLPRVPKIYFGTRTHKQLEQVVKELRKTTYSATLKMSILAGRDHTCIRDEFRSIKKSITDQCKALLDGTANKDAVNPPGGVNFAIEEQGSGCKFLDNKDAMTKNFSPVGIWDVNEFVALGKERGACPYYAARTLADDADIIFCPYNYLVNPLIRKNMSIGAEGDIIIIDEAHNIEDVCRDSASVDLELDHIKLAMENLNFLQMPSRKLETVEDHATMQKNKMAYAFLESYLTKWSDWFENHIGLFQKTSENESNHVMSGYDVALSLKNHQIGYQHCRDFKDLARDLLNELKKLRQDKDRKKSKSRTISSPTAVLLELMIFLYGNLFRNNCGNLDDYVGLLNKSTTLKAMNNTGDMWLGKNMKREVVDKLTLKMSCMNPALVFGHVSEEARCVTLASGTLAPIKSFAAELGALFPRTAQAGHIINPKQVWVGSLNSGPSGHPMKCTYQFTSSPEWQDDLGELILWTCSNVPHGVLCFLPSYRLMEILEMRWNITGLWGKLERCKSVFTESHTTRDHEQKMNDFYECVGDDDGALLFAVFRGKVSEGMDFKDHQARAVITVGIPFPNVRDVLVDSKKSYNDKYEKGRNLLSGKDWYEIQAFRALNQALGRCIRHRNDWGAVIMVDSRFSIHKNKEQISKWVRDFLGNNHHNWESFTRGPNSLVKFIEEMKRTQPDTSKMAVKI